MANMKVNKWAVLIGIDYYISGTSREGVHEYLRDWLGVQDSHIYRLTATTPGDDDSKAPRGDRSQRPTYENIIKVLQQVSQEARPKDLVYLHYSGHGIRVKTIFGDLKGEDGIDEALVPTDIACVGGRYVRDVEIAYLLREMVKKELVITVVLDCCHSGSADRGQDHGVDSRIRGISMVDTNKLNSDISALPYHTMYWKPRQGLFQLAGEKPAWRITGCLHRVDTHFLLHAGHKRLRSSARGEGDRLFYSGDRLELLYTSTVVEVGNTKGNTTVRLNAGEAHGISKGMGVWLFKAVTAEAVLVEPSTPGQQLKVGCLALPRSTLLLQRLVRLVYPESLGEDDASERALNAVRKAWETHGTTFAPLTDGPNGGETFQVHVRDGMYDILGGDGQRLQYAVLPLPTDAERAAEKLVRSLTHLAKYHGVLDLRSLRSGLASWISVQLTKKPYAFPLEPRLATDPPSISSTQQRCKATVGG
ncbi:caspase domain-containing protein [Lasiosphaeria miniovina]|uniref:Caspase domain-containing protein n=1 Tax=Lasiosphaeria miniovina TaxID=1954250 RepID=A0AA39ZZP9_9PEZI|nr:caspase domain-containing protein [Lasiosphaeria miniovina]KAK0706618.1 caspase domain-containing protein [Lasiosphaeria miniovina]